MKTEANDDRNKARFLSLLTRVDIASGGATTASSNQIRAALSPHDAASGLPSGVVVRNFQPWVNYQGNLDPEVVLRQYSMAPLPPTEWKTGVERVSDIVRYSEANGGGLRAVGSAWSSSRICQTPTNLLECSSLSGHAQEIPASQLAHGVDPTLIAHLHAGTTIQTANVLLEQREQSLQVMGGNAGQNIAGIVATGTHGSWIDRHAVADSIRALALVSAGGKKYWIEPSSRPLTSRDTFDGWGGFFEVVRDDALFSAAQVSLGALGIATSVVLDVNRIYTVEFERTTRAWDTTLQRAIFSHDLDLTPLFGDRRPDHFEIVMNPYKLGAGQNGVFMETGYVRPDSPAKARSVSPYHAELVEHSKLDYWPTVAKLLSDHPALVPPVLDAVLPLVFGQERKTGHLSDIWPLSTGGPPLISTELAVAQSDVERALELLLTHVDYWKGHNFYWPGVFGIRFGKKTGALLGFTRFDRWCTMELIYLLGVRGVEDFLERYYADLTSKRIAYTVHPGQVNFVDAAQVRSMYGEDTLGKWHAARQRLGVDNQLFANAMTNRWGLT